MRTSPRCCRPPGTASGVAVASTVAGAIDSADGGLEPGDVRRAVNRQPVAAVADLQRFVEGLRAGEAVVLHPERRGELRYLAFVVD